MCSTKPSLLNFCCSDMTAQQVIHIHAPPEQIFQYIMDVNNRIDYIPALEEVIMLTEGPIRLGSRYTEVALIGGRRIETTYELVDYRENVRSSAKTIKSIFPIRADLELKPTSDGTDLRIALEFKLSGIFKLGSKIVAGIVNQQAIGILKRIKANVEANSQIL